MAILWEEIKSCLPVASGILCQVPSMVTKMGFVSMLFSNVNQNDYKIHLEYLHSGPLVFWK